VISTIERRWKIQESMNTQANAGEPEKTVHIFVSYAREDKLWLDPEYRYNLIPFLAESLRRYSVVFWYDKELKPGDVFKRQIESEIDQAKIALLIVSQSFLNSEFIEHIEMTRITERARRGETIVIPVLVEPCDWSDYPFLADRQMVPSANPLIDFTESEAKWAKVKFQILDGLKAQLKRIREPVPAPTPAAYVVEGPAAVFAAPASLSAAVGSDRMTGAGSIGDGAHGNESAASSHGVRIPAWAWGVGAALLLLAIYFGVHSNSHPLPAGSPQSAPAPAQSPTSTGGPIETGPAAPATTHLTTPTTGPANRLPANPGVSNAPSLTSTMKTIQGELSSIGTVSFTVFGKNTANGTTGQYAAVNQISDVVADAAQCRVSYHLTTWRNGAAQPTVNKQAWFILHDVTSVVVEPGSQLVTENNAAGGHSNMIATSTSPSLTALVVHMPSWVNGFPFKDSASADRAAKTVTQAVRLCGGHLAN
jgi:TIR domain